MQASMDPPAKAQAAAAAVVTAPTPPRTGKTAKPAAAVLVTAPTPPRTGKAAVVTAPTPPRPGKAGPKPTTLLDVQEVEWITRELERLLARGQGGGDAGEEDGRHSRKRAKVSPAAAPKKGGSSFLAELLGRHAASICSGDAVLGSSAAASRDDRGRRRGGRRGFREVEKV